MMIESSARVTCIPDWAGERYLAVLERLHQTINPQTYFEIGTSSGRSLSLAKCASLAVDPVFAFDDIALVKRIMAKPRLALYQIPSDAFFAKYNPAALLGAPIDIAFLDGMHQCEFLLRDFINTERHCRRNSIIALHDCLPVELSITARTQDYGAAILPHRTGWWAGDVWRTGLLLRRRRPDLRITALNAAFTGLLLITDLNPDNAAFGEGYAAHVQEMMSWRLEEIGLPQLFTEMQVESTATLAEDHQIKARFRL